MGQWLTQGKQMSSPLSPSTQPHSSVGEGDGVALGAVGSGEGSAVTDGAGVVTVGSGVLSLIHI